MNRRNFLSKIFLGAMAFFGVGAVVVRERSIEQLEEDFYKAAVALHRYRELRGLRPGVLVWAQYRDEPPKLGVLAPYGEKWGWVDHPYVPVIFGDGHWQPWPISDLRVMSFSAG